MSTQLSFGVRDGLVVHISDVDNGLACNCKCAQCGMQLVARNNGQFRIAHFAHYSATECEHALETALHLAAKEILQRALTIRLPAITWANYVVCDEQVAKIEAVRLECLLGDLKPDVIVETMGHTLLIEIAVTHFIDPVKEDKIRNLSISTIEINLSAIKESWTFRELREILVEKVENKEWVFSRKLEAFKERKWEEIRVESEQRIYSEEEIKAITMGIAEADKRALARYTGSKDYKVFKGFEEAESRCPKKISLKKELLASPNYQDNTIQQILRSERWDGKIYVTHPEKENSFGRYVVVDGHHVPIIEDHSHWDEDLAAKTYVRFEQVEGLKETLFNKEFGDCKHCEYSHKYFNIFDEHFEVCQYPKSDLSE